MLRALPAVVLIAACRPAAPASPFLLRVAVFGPLGVVAPQVPPGSWTTIAVSIVFQRLVAIGPAGQIVPVLASKAEPAGPHALRIWLRRDARFSDGSPLGFDEVAESLVLARLHAVHEGDAILVSSDEGDEPVELILSRANVFRRSGDRLLGTGAFAVKEQDGTHILLERVEPAPGFIETVRIDSYATPEDAFAHTLKGDADMLPEVKPRWVEFFENVPRFRILRGASQNANMVAFNIQRLSRAERIALVHALSADEIRRLAFGDDCIPPDHRPEARPLPPGRPLDIIAVPFFDRFAVAVRRVLGERGREVRTLETQEFVTTVRRGDFDLATARPRISPPMVAVSTWRTGSTTNVLHYSNPVVDSALDARDWAKAQRALEEDPPGAVICTPAAVVVLDSRIRNAQLTTDFKESLPKWEVSQ